MSFLTDDEIESFRIENMILHVVGREQFRIESARQVEHESFFKSRILETNISAVHEFQQDSDTKFKLEQVVASPDTFESVAQDLSKDFSKQHVKASREGAFFIFMIGFNDADVKIFSLIKYDFSEVIEQTDGSDGSLLRRILNAFTTDKKAVQKSALIRVQNGEAVANVAAKDRTKVQPDITDYFATFLGTHRVRSDSELTHELADALRELFISNCDILPNNDVPKALSKTKSILRERQKIDEEAVIEAIWSVLEENADDKIKDRIKSKANRKLSARKLSGLEFRPDKKIFKKPPLREIRTAEGVTVTYPNRDDNSLVARTKNEGGGETIVINTERVTNDTLIRDKTR